MGDPGYEIRVFLDRPFEEAVEAVTAALKEQGFGVLTTIDVQATLRARLGAEMERYVILGACNPPLAHRALEADRSVGLLLPCNVVVAERGAGCRVSILDPEAMMGLAEAPAIDAVAGEAAARLRSVAERLAGGS